MRLMRRDVTKANEYEQLPTCRACKRTVRRYWQLGEDVICVGCLDTMPPRKSLKTKGGGSRAQA